MAAINQTLTIANGGTSSPIISALPLAPAMSIWIAAPATMPETVKLRARRSGGSTFYDQQTAGADIVMTAGKATQVTVLSGVDFKLEAGGAVAEARVFEVVVNRIGEPFMQ